MTQTLTRQLVGYDPRTDAVAVEYSIPEEKWTTVMGLVERDDDDPDHIYAYPLGISVANDIIGILGHPRDQNLKYFLECESR